jgi:hypothetical protein
MSPMSDRSPSPDSDEEHAAQIAAARRTLAVAVAFGATLPGRGAAPAAAAILDALLVAVAAWALAPGLSAGGPRFLRPGHWSRLLPFPLLLALLALIHDVWRLVRHGDS